MSAPGNHPRRIPNSGNLEQVKSADACVRMRGLIKVGHLHCLGSGLWSPACLPKTRVCYVPKNYSLELGPLGSQAPNPNKHCHLLSRREYDVLTTSRNASGLYAPTPNLHPRNLPQLESRSEICFHPPCHADQEQYCTLITLPQVGAVVCQDQKL